MQTYSNFEVLLVDDGSTDNSGDICDAFASQDSRIRVLHQLNEGQAAARNHALDIAKGDYIGFVDSDDWIHPQMYEILLNHAFMYNAQVSVGGYINAKVYDNNFNNFYNVELPQIWDGKSFLRHCLCDAVDKKPWVLWDKVFSKQCFANIRMPEGRINEDNAIIYKILYESDIVVDCNVPLYYYYYNTNGTMLNCFSKKHLDWLLVLEEMIDYFQLNSDDVLLDKANKMYLYALQDMYIKVKTNINDTSLDRELKEKLKKQYSHEKKRYQIDLKSHPQLYEIIFPVLTRLYWKILSFLNKIKR